MISISIDDNDWLFWSATVIAGIGGGLLITVLFNIMFTKQKFTNYNEDMPQHHYFNLSALKVIFSIAFFYIYIFL